jgi:XapX domain-containing protein
VTKIIEALLLGLAVGALFGFTRQDVPAPPTLAGVAGILGITLGWLLIRRLR